MVMSTTILYPVKIESHNEYGCFEYVWVQMQLPVMLNLRANKPNWVSVHVVAMVCSLSHSKAITQLVAGVIIKYLRPINFVDGEGFQSLMNYVEPGIINHLQLNL